MYLSLRFDKNLNVYLNLWEIQEKDKCNSIVKLTWLVHSSPFFFRFM